MSIRRYPDILASPWICHINTSFPEFSALENPIGFHDITLRHEYLLIPQKLSVPQKYP
jgi:hypothetical protein